MIRVGFLLAGDPGAWLGGLNYFRSLLGALETLEDRRIEPILLTDHRHAEAWGRHFPGVERVATSLLDRWTPAWVARKGVQVLAGRDLLLQRRLRGLGISCLSHSGPLGRAPGIKTLGWIPDFQHVHLPECFSAEELRKRDRAFLALCRECDRVIVSSQTAGMDAAAFCPPAADRVRVLHFVPRTPNIEELPSLEVLRQAYGFAGPYFHLPNQFWSHKNHAVVIEALRILRESGRPALVLATGLTRDYRNPGHFEALMEQARRAGVDGDFRVLGVVPFLDMLGLMRCSTALINPSRFEGWSTTVEEARRLGVAALLSDIPVHREQAIPGASYFPPDDPAALARLMAVHLDSPPSPTQAPGAERSYQAFGEAYQALVLELFGGGR
jgi:glycosyltransferase involved in cell wall biosynthesis